MMGFLVAATMAMPFSFGEVKVSCAEPGDWKVASRVCQLSSRCALLLC